MKMSAKRGSALLIVLGFLSFMVVSAVAFSIYMRSERLPSSALRRTVATRHLVKAALARAIGDIDDAVRDEPFPGCMGTGGPKIGTSYGGAWSGYSDSRRADWYGRVFLPIGGRSESGMFINRREDPFLIPPEHRSKSVSTMTLEGLGYIPPPLVNEARLIGPLSWASTWHYFDYDAGRYAYTALNVSDYFDINRIHAYTNRTSGADGRLSLAYLLADTQGKVDPNKAKSFEQLVHGNRGGQPNYAFVSMLDYSLALRTTGASFDLANPFYEFLQNGRWTEFYGNSSWPDGLTEQDLYKDPKFKKIANQVFVTDSWCPTTNTIDATTCNLSDPNWQPFKRVDETPASLTDLLANLNNNFREKYKGQFPFISFYAALYDYLDYDDVPTSLVMPCTEQAPMVSALSIMGTPLVMIKKTIENPDDDTKITRYTMDLDLSPISVMPTVVFPFKRVANPDSFKIQVAARVFFSPFTEKEQRLLRGLSRAGLDNESDWNKTDGSRVDDSSIVVISRFVPISIPKNVTDDSSMVINVPGVTFGNPGASKELLLLTVTEKKETDLNGNTTTKESSEIGDFRFLREGYALTENLEAAVDVVPQVALKVRVVNSAGDTVDLAPAMAVDDQNLNNMSWGPFEAESAQICGSANPFLLFTAQAGGTALRQNKASLDAVLAGNNQNMWTAGDYDYKFCSCPDPRYNWAPEDWIFRASSEQWLNVADRFFDNIRGDSYRDHDLVMGVSNMGYLQSVGELMFIPRMKECLASGGTEGMWGDLQVDGGLFNGVMRYDDKQPLHHDMMWCTYKPRQIGGDDELYELNMQNGSGGYRVNPYTDNSTIFLAAVANTPVDWWAAATNKNLGAACRSKNLKNSMLTDPEKALDYTFGPSSKTDQWKYEEEVAIAAKLKAGMLANSQSASSWQRAYDEVWNAEFASDKDDQLFGVQVSNSTIHDVDRKFLYDFWRGCFGCCQQLFLIFVRAESTALGGSGDAVTPGQLGGRAVALVWRDPNPPAQSQDGNLDKPEDPETSRDSSPRPPHKTRILFYHQFD